MNAAVDKDDARFLREAIELAREHSVAGSGGPFGALIVREGLTISRGWNEVLSTNDPTAHAEIVAIRVACQAFNTFHLDSCTLYTSCEPCPMCLAAAYWARMKRIVYAATRHDAAAIGFADTRLYRELTLTPHMRELRMDQALRDEAVTVMRVWESLPGKIIY
jgi:guanine deaminase